MAYGFASKAAEYAPANPYAWSNLGYLAEQQFRFADAESHYSRAMSQCRTDDQRGTVFMNWSSLLCTQGRYAEAEVAAEKAVKLKPGKQKAKANLGLARLALGRWDTGWKLYDESLGLNAILQRGKIDYGVPDWDGSRQRVVMFGEQGLGDEICFASFIPDVQERASSLIVDCDLRLKGLFRRSFPGVEIHGTRWAKERSWVGDAGLEAAVSMLGAGKFVRDQGQFPGKPYLKADPERVLMWKALFASFGKPVYGLAWSGGLPETGEQFKRFTPDDMAPILAKDAVFVSLQYKPEQAHPKIRTFRELLSKDYDDTAALVAALDCVIAPPTAVVHLAGALGTKTLAMKGPYSCWKYHAGLPFTKDNVTLIEHQGTWQKTIEAAAKHL